MIHVQMLLYIEVSSRWEWLGKRHLLLEDTYMISKKVDLEDAAAFEHGASLGSNDWLVVTIAVASHVQSSFEFDGIGCDKGSHCDWD